MTAAIHRYLDSASYKRILQHSPHTKSRKDITFPAAFHFRMLLSAKQKERCVSHRSSFQSGDPSRIRTCDLLIRSQTLYPAELWSHSVLLVLKQQSYYIEYIGMCQQFFRKKFYFFSSFFSPKVMHTPFRGCTQREPLIYPTFAHLSTTFIHRLCEDVDNRASVILRSDGSMRRIRLLLPRDG